MPPRIRDWRKPEYREELFLRYFHWRISVHDLDHSHYCQTLCQYMDDEERCWFAFLFGMTYRTPQAYAYWSYFPRLLEIDWDAVEEWHVENWKRTTYGTDARYNKGYFVQQARSVYDWAKDSGSLLNKVTSLVRTKSPSHNFQSLFEEIQGLYKYGRMTGWITCQCLYDVLGLNIDFDNVLIYNPSSDSSSQSIWNGYWTLKNDPAKFLGKYSTTDYKVTDQDYQTAVEDIMKYRIMAEQYTGLQVDVFKWESIWCQFKRLFHPVRSWEYPGHSSGDATSRYLYYRKHWPEIDWAPFRKALLSQESIIKGQTYEVEHNKLFGRTGLLLNMHEMYPDMPNVHKVLGLNPNQSLVRELFTDEGVEVPTL